MIGGSNPSLPTKKYKNNKKIFGSFKIFCYICKCEKFFEIMKIERMKINDCVYQLVEHIHL